MGIITSAEDIRGMNLFLFCNDGYGANYFTAARRYQLPEGVKLTFVFSGKNRRHLRTRSLLRMAQAGRRVLFVRDVNSDGFLAQVQEGSHGIICGFNQIFKARSLARFRSMVNFHPSLLPYYRGPVPSHWCIENRERASGVTLHVVTARIDEGEILSQREVPVLTGDSPETLDERISVEGARLLVHYLDHLVRRRHLEREVVNADAVYDKKVNYRGFPRDEVLRVLQSTREWLTLTKTWLDHQVRSLPQGDVESAVFCVTTANLDRFPAARLHRVRGASLRDRLFFRASRMAGLEPVNRRLSAVSSREHPDIIHSHFGDWAWETLPGIRETGLPHVVSFYGWDMSLLPKSDPIWIDRYRDLFGAVDRCLCEGPHMAARVVELGCPADKVKVQRLGIDLSLLPFRPRSYRSGDTLRVLIAGSFREKKGIPDAMDALGSLHRSGVPVEVTVIGDAGALPRAIAEKERILAAVARNRLERVVRFLGYQPYPVFLEEAYAHHVFLSPSVTAADGDIEGGAPVSILEMAATGMPVVTTEHCDIPYALGGLHAGAFFAPERTPEVLAEHLNWLESNPDSWRDRVQGVRKHLEEFYDWQVVGQGLLEHYRALISGSVSE